MITFKDILTFLEIDCVYASLIALYFVVLGISIPKTDLSDYFNNLNLLLKVKNQHAFNGHTDFLVTIIELLRFLNRT